MAILLHNSARVLLRRSAQRQQHSFQSGTKRGKANTAPASETKHSAPTKTDIKSAPDPNLVTYLPLWQRLGPLSTAFNAYGRTQRKRPWATQLGTSLVIYLCGDLTAQYIDGEDYNPLRTLRHLTVGAISSIPSYTWFMYLSRAFNYPSQLLSLATKVIVNQIVFTPLFNTYFFGMQALLAGDTLLDAWERINNTVPTSFVLASYGLL